jgi:hypothetical protein
MARPVALDHNFPKPVLASVDRWLKEVEFHHIRDLDSRLAELQDHELVYELHDRGLQILVTHNWKMENDARVVVAVHLRRFTLLTRARSSALDPAGSSRVRHIRSCTTWHGTPVRDCGPCGAGPQLAVVARHQRSVR